MAPSRVGIEAWAKLGNPEWNYDALLPYYKRAYSIQPPSSDVCKTLGIDYVSNTEDSTRPCGPIHVSFPSLAQQNPIVKAWNDVLRSMGYKATVEPIPVQNAGNRCYSAAIDAQTGSRSFADSQYGKPASGRRNLTIITEATILKISFSNASSGKAVAREVDVSMDGGTYKIKANREIILSAGAFHTPKLLELSGVGELSRLQKLDIAPVIENENVGENLQNHVWCMCTFELQEKVQVGNGIQSMAFLPLQGQIQRELLDGAVPASDAERHAYFIRRAILDSPDEASCCVFLTFIGEPNFASLGAIQTVPFSRGSSHIASSNPEDNPSIDPRFFANTVDLEIMANHLLALQAFPSTSPLSAFFKQDGQRLSPNTAINDLESARSYLRENAMTAYHSCGTAAMLPRRAGGVVDQNLVVYGTSNLRIVDASIFPVIPQANPMSTVYAVAEKAADLIKSVF